MPTVIFLSSEYFSLGNYIYVDFEGPVPNQCLSDTSREVGVQPRDYTNYYYVIMGMALLSSTSLTIFMNPKMRRSNEDENKLP